MPIAVCPWLLIFTDVNPICPDQASNPLLLGVICVLLFAFDVSQGLAQRPVYKSYNVDNGLASSTVYYALQDSRGYLWFATKTGLSRYDGYQFENYFTQDGLPTNEVFIIYEDGSGRIWPLSFSRQLSYFSDGKLYHAHNNDLLAKIRTDDFFTSFVEDRAGNLWFGSYDKQLIQVTPDKEVVNHKLNHRMIRYLWEDETGMIRAGSAEGVINITANPDRLEYPFLSGQSAEQYLITSDGRWLASAISNLYVLQDDHWKLVGNRTFQSKAKAINYLYQSGDKSIWICTQDGVWRFENGDLDAPGEDRYLNGVAVYSVLEDREQNIWFNTQKSGVLKTETWHNRSFTTADGLPDNNISCIMVNRSGELLLGFDQLRLGTLNTQTHGYKSLDLPFSQWKGIINDIILDPDGNIWLAADEYLSCVSPSGHKRLFPVGSVKSIALDRQGALILGCHSFAGYIQPKRLAPFSIDHNNPANSNFDRPSFRAFIDSIAIYGERTYAVHPAADGKIWLGTMNGLKYYHEDRVHDIKRKDGILDGRITDIKSDSKGHIWVTTFDNGVVLLTPDSVYHLTAASGLGSNICTRLFIDEKDRAWICSNKGISAIVFDRSAPEPFSISRYTTQDQLISNEVNDLYVIHDTVWAATAKGLSRIVLPSLERNTEPPPVYITSLTINRQPVQVQHQIELAHHLNNLRIGFTGISFRGISAYHYRMLGLDTNWNATSERSVEFASLSPGRYSFEVLAINSNGIHSSKAALMAFTIHPPVWKTWWFKTLLALGFAGMIYLFFRIRVLTYNKDVVRVLIRMMISKLQKEEVLVAKSLEGPFIKIPLRDLWWIQSSRNYIEIVTPDRKYLVRTTLKEIENKLQKKKYIVRLHKSYIVNLKVVRTFKSNAVEINDTVIPVGNSYKHVLNAMKKKLELSKNP